MALLSFKQNTANLFQAEIAGVKVGMSKPIMSDSLDVDLTPVIAATAGFALGARYLRNKIENAGVDVESMAESGQLDMSKAMRVITGVG